MQLRRGASDAWLVAMDLSFDLELIAYDMRAAGCRAEEFGALGVARQIETGR